MLAQEMLGTLSDNKAAIAQLQQQLAGGAVAVHHDAARGSQPGTPLALKPESVSVEPPPRPEHSGEAVEEARPQQQPSGMPSMLSAWLGGGAADAGAAVGEGSGTGEPARCGCSLMGGDVPDRGHCT